MANRQLSPKTSPIMINYAENFVWSSSLTKMHVGGRGFHIVDQVETHKGNGCTKICYSELVPGLVVIHGPRGYITHLKRWYGRGLRPVKATPKLLEEAIWQNAERFDSPILKQYLERDIARMLSPSARSDSFEIGCTPEVYEESAKAESAGRAQRDALLATTSY